MGMSASQARFLCLTARKSNVEFDSNIHQGVLTEKVSGMDAGLVAEIMQKGYILKGKVIRPAMVKVSE